MLKIELKFDEIITPQLITNFRRLMQWLVNSRPFEYCIILTIVGNCVVMSMDTHLANGDKTILALQLVKLTAVLMRS